MDEQTVFPWEDTPGPEQQPGPDQQSGARPAEAAPPTDTDAARDPWSAPADHAPTDADGPVDPWDVSAEAVPADDATPDPWDVAPVEPVPDEGMPAPSGEAAAGEPAFPWQSPGEQWGGEAPGETHGANDPVVEDIHDAAAEDAAAEDIGDAAAEDDASALSRLAPLQERPIARREYYSISEVCELVELKPHVLRYWEAQFPLLSPAKNRSGNRVFQRKEIRLILLVRHLLYEEKYTIEGARAKLEQMRRGGDLAEATRGALDRHMIGVLRAELRRLAEVLVPPAD